MQKVSDEHILQLADYAKKIEEHYGNPIDIERAVENDDIYILQARPITTLEHQREIFEKDYTRDTTLIIQQARNDGFLAEILDSDIKIPYEIPVIHYMHH
jgi:phosphoenolpyruvate synthase/pyruvate phosphate dikinase